MSCAGRSSQKHRRFYHRRCWLFRRMSRIARTGHMSSFFSCSYVKKNYGYGLRMPRKCMLPSPTHRADRQLRFSAGQHLQTACPRTPSHLSSMHSLRLPPQVLPKGSSGQRAELRPTNPSASGSSGMIPTLISKDLTGQSTTEPQEALLWHFSINKERGCQPQHPTSNIFPCLLTCPS